MNLWVWQRGGKREGGLVAATHRRGKEHQVAPGAGGGEPVGVAKGTEKGHGHALLPITDLERSTWGTWQGQRRTSEGGSSL